MVHSEARVSLCEQGLKLGETMVPLYVGAVHYWRLEPEHWLPCLQAAKSLGIKIIDTYIPWAAHEISPGELDFGDRFPKLAIGKFLELIQELGMYALIRPGPHINAEMTYFGIPERVIWDRDCQAKTPKGNPVVLPMVPKAFPVPSYASRAFLREAEVFLRHLAVELSPKRYPEGPIVMLQIDNEGAYYFRDGVYDQDFHPDALEAYRTFLQQAYETPEKWAEAYGTQADSLTDYQPPHKWNVQQPGDLRPHWDWAVFQEHILKNFMGEVRSILDKNGLDGLPTMHNFPMGEETTPLQATLVEQAVDLVSLDYYYKAGEQSRRIIARRSTACSVRCQSQNKPSFAAEMGIGFPPFFPPLQTEDGLFTLLTALAYGMRGFNWYMLVERDRWVGSPISASGKKRPWAEQLTKICAALEQVQFHTLQRRVPVVLVVPSGYRKLSRLMHAYGPVPGAMFSLLNLGFNERCFEEDIFQEGWGLAQTEQWLRVWENSLDELGVPYALLESDDVPKHMGSPAWLLCPTTAGVEPSLLESMKVLAKQGVSVLIGPDWPAWQRLDQPWPDPGALALELQACGIQRWELISDDESNMNAVRKQVETLALPSLVASKANFSVTVHETKEGQPKVVFVINTSSEERSSDVSVPGIAKLLNLLTGEEIIAKEQGLEVKIPGSSVGMFEVIG
jgi:beta-galactosidase